MKNSPHRANVLAVSCLKMPVDPRTRAPLALYERERTRCYATRHHQDGRHHEDETEPDSESESGGGWEDRGDRVDPPPCRTTRQTTRRAPPPGPPIDLRQLSSSNREYCRKLDELKRAHRRTMAELEEMCRDKLAIGDLAQVDARRSMTGKSARKPVCTLRKAFSAVELSHEWGCGPSDSSPEEGVADDGAGSEESQLTSPRERIRNMWRNFAVEEPPPRPPRKHQPRRSSLPSERAGRGGGSGRSKGTGEEPGDTWRHRVTVPQPFSMTVREAERKRRGAKSRSEAELEGALLCRRLAELAECHRKFRASPAPAHVRLPLYQEIAARDQERRQQRRLLDRQRRAGISPQEPFSFLERERRMKEEKEARSRPRGEEEEEEGATKPKLFRAKPVPRHVYDSTVSERMKEDQLYRAIKMQMRARDLLQSASLPRGMAAAAQRSSQHTQGEERTEADFRPRINRDVPDLDGSYRRFREQLLSRRGVRPTTACKPFRLRTALTAACRQRTPSHSAPPGPAQAPRRLRRTPARPPASSSSLGSSLSGSLDELPLPFPPARTTDAAKMRQEAVRRLLEQRTKAEEEEESLRRRRAQRERRLQGVVSRRARANDPHQALSQTGRAKLRQFRKQDLERRKEYQEEMREIQERVRERPLLLEQVTLRNARRAAEKRFTDALRGHGLSDDLISGMAPARRPRRRSPGDQSSVSSEMSGGTGDLADDYADDYEELDDQDMSGKEEEEEEGQEEDDGDKDAEEEEGEEAQDDTEKEEGEEDE